MLEALIFDVDGTLAETEEAHRGAFNAAFAHAGLDWVWDAALYRELLQVAGGKERIAAFAPQTPAATIAALHADKTMRYGAMVRGGGAPLRPGVKALIDEAHSAGLRLAIATTTSLDNVEALLRATLGAEWNALFGVVAAGDMARAKKPAPDVYRLVLDRLALPAHACIAIEDSRNGVESARAAGVPVVAVRSAYLAGDDLSGALAVYDDTQALTLALMQRLHAAA